MKLFWSSKSPWEFIYGRSGCFISQRSSKSYDTGVPIHFSGNLVTISLRWGNNSLDFIDTHPTTNHHLSWVGEALLIDFSLISITELSSRLSRYGFPGFWSLPSSRIFKHIFFFLSRHFSSHHTCQSPFIFWITKESDVWHISLFEIRRASSTCSVN